MEMKHKIRVLIVDDSIFFREVMTKGISLDDSIEVVATASDPFDARDKILKYKPDVMTCDVEMPKMNGIEFIRRLLPQYPLPIIVVSAVSGVVFDALRAGAIDYVGKPDFKSVNSVENFINEMISKIKIASSAKIMKQDNVLKNIDKKMGKANMKAFNRPGELIAIGASTGGTEAIYHVLKNLPDNIPGIVIVQHIPAGFSRMFADRMDMSTSLKVKEGATGDFVEAGHVYIAPGDQHMIIKKIGDRYKIECFEDQKVNGHCPSVDVLFESVAKEAGKNSIGVILTGMGCDGAKGLLSMKKMGAKTIGQDEESSIVYGMPKVAFNIGAVEKQVPLDKIASTICSLLR